MAQDGTTAGGASYTLDNVTFPVGRTKLQSIFDAIRSTNIGNTAPDLVAGQFWIDNNTPSTTVWTLYFFDGTDSIQFATIDTINNTVNFIDSTFTQLTSNLDLNSYTINGTGNIDITGTVTSDKFTITEGEIEGNSNNFQIQSLVSGIIYDASNGFHTFKDNGTNAFQIRSGGDIYLGYEDTGTTPKLFWDASAESLGIGTTSIPYITSNRSVLGINGSTDSLFAMQRGGGNNFYVHNNATQTAFINTSALPLTFGTNSAERMRIDSSGNVGIGTSSPSVSLDIEGSGTPININSTNSEVKKIQFENNGTAVGYLASSAGTPFRIFDGTPTELMRIDSSGNVGIGTASPNNYTNYKSLTINGTTGGLIDFESNGTLMGEIYCDASKFYIDSEGSFPLVFRTNGSSERMRINSSGNVSIGTSNASSTQRLTLKGDFSTIESGILFDVGGNQTVISHADATSPSFVISNKTASGVLRFDTNSTERMRIDSSGNVGIGTSSPEGTLHLENVSNNTLIMDSPANRFNSIGFQSAGVDKWWLGRADSDQISGDAFFIGVDNGNAVDAGGLSNKLVITQTGKVGIGVSDPLQPLEISYSNTGAVPTDSLAESTTGALQLYNNSNSANFAGIYLRARTSNSTNSVIGLRYNSSYDDGDMFFSIRNGTTTSKEVLTLQSSGNVGIGTSSPTVPLHIKTTGGVNAQLNLEASSFTPAVRMYSGGASVVPAINYGSGSGNSGLRFLQITTGAGIDGTTTERMRIDSSGNVLVGKTGTSNQSNGFALIPNGASNIVRDGGACMQFNRKTTDGDILQFVKDTTTVGSIGTRFGYTRIGVSNTNLIFDGVNDRIAPSDNNLNAQDNTTTLGWSDRRFKDLYLGGNIYLGGTGSANALDDYEEGTFNPTLTPSTSGSITISPTTDALKYIKISNTVFIQGRLTISSSSSPTGNSIALGNMPFTPSSSVEGSGWFGGMCAVSFNGSATFEPYTVWSLDGTVRITTTTASVNSNTRIHFNFFYETA